jgi:two-component system, sensor histidine kinase and response regulator
VQMSPDEINTSETHSMPHSLPTHDKKSILLIDDSLDLLLVNQTILEMAGYEVTIASSGSQALSVLKNSEFDLVVLDLYLDDMTGFEVMAKIRSELSGPIQQVPVVILTGLNDVKVDGAAGVIHKPCDIDSFLGAISKFLK